MQSDNGKTLGGRAAAPETRAHGTAPADKPRRRRRRRRGRSGRPSKSSVPVSIRVPIEVVNALRSIAVQTDVGHPFAAVWAPDPDDNFSLAPLVKKVVFWWVTRMILWQIWLNDMMIQAEQVPDDLRGHLVAKVPDDLHELRRLHPAIELAFSEFSRIPSDSDRVLASLKTGSLDPEVVERALRRGPQQPRDESDPSPATKGRT